VSGDGKPSLKERLLWRTPLTPGTRIEEDSPSMARAFTYLFGIGGLLLLGTLLLPGAPDRDVAGLIAVAVVAIAAAAAFTIGFDRLPLVAFKLGPALGSTVIGGVLYFGGADAIGAYATYFFWVTLSAAYFFSLRIAVAHVAYAVGVYAAMLAIVPGAPLPDLYWVMAAGTLFVAGPLIVALRAHAERAAAEADRVKGEFFALISHELRTPLTSIIGYLDVLLEDGDAPGTPQQQQALDVINRNSRRLMRLVGDLLFVARVDAGNVELERGEFDLAEVVRESVDTFRDRAKREGLELGSEIAEVGNSPGDAGRIGQAVDNLISNSVKFTPEGGSITVRLRPEPGGRAAIEVADTGMGIPEAEQAKLFDHFYRSSGARLKEIEGTGLGLAIVKTIVEGHDGTIAFDSSEGEGTTATISLPLAAGSGRLAARPSPGGAPADRHPA
jgi:signal transduction histidine kinase